MTSDELRIALSPEIAYRRLAGGSGSPATSLLVRLTVIVAVFGVVTSHLVTGRVTVHLFLIAALSWSFVPLIQMLTGSLLILTTAGRQVTFVRALDLWFAGHLPFSLWLLFVAGWNAVAGGLPYVPLLLTSLVPAVWTTAIVSTYCRTVLLADEGIARRRVIVHVLVSWSLVIAYILAGSGGLAGALGFIARRLGLDG